MTSSSTDPPRGRGRRFGRALWREIGLPLLMALVVIQFVIQAFKIPSGSMENSLMVGDYLLGLKFPYGSPLPWGGRLPIIDDPDPGDVVIFRYPMHPAVPGRDPDRYDLLARVLLLGEYHRDRQPDPGAGTVARYVPQDFIKRVVAVSGQTVQVHGGLLTVDGYPAGLPPEGKLTVDRKQIDQVMRLPADSTRLVRIPSPGDTLHLDSMNFESFGRAWALILQEHPHAPVRCSVWAEVGGRPLPNASAMIKLGEGDDPNWVMRVADQVGRDADGNPAAIFRLNRLADSLSRFYLPYTVNPDDPIQHASPTPYLLGRFEKALRQSWQTAHPDSGELRLRFRINFGESWESTYLVTDRVFWVMGDNRDNSADSRFWGFVSQRNARARGLVIYYSIDNHDGRVSLFNPFTWWRLPERIRWNRIGRLVHDP